MLTCLLKTHTQACAHTHLRRDADCMCHSWKMETKTYFVDLYIGVELLGLPFPFGYLLLLLVISPNGALGSVAV